LKGLGLYIYIHDLNYYNNYNYIQYLTVYKSRYNNYYITALSEKVSASQYIDLYTWASFNIIIPNQ